MDNFSSSNGTNAIGRANLIVPGKRPLSSMCPSILINETSGDVHMVIGGAGGTQTTTGVAQVLARHLVLGDNMQTAITGPRIHHQLVPNHVTYEPFMSPFIVNGLRSRGHAVKPLLGPGSAVVVLDKERSANPFSPNTVPLVAHSDNRKGGSVAGY